jgi:hypothetical protein
MVDAIRQIGVSEVACEMNSSTARSFTRYPKPRSLSRAGVVHYNTIRPHASFGYKPPAPKVFVHAFAAWPATVRQPAPPATLAQQPALN